MAMYLVQYRRKLVSAPIIGKWQVYSAAWFQSSTPTPSAPVLAGIQNLFLGKGYAGTGTTWTVTNVFDLGANNGLITVHLWDTDHKVKQADHVVTVPTYASGSPVSLPMQTSIAVGYRSSSGANPRRGRSRFFIGPLAVPTTCWSGAYVGGGRLNSTGLTAAKTNAVNALAGLEAAGWELQVSTGVGPPTNPRAEREFNDALELYIDDVPDIQRSRRPWVIEQQRSAI